MAAKASRDRGRTRSQARPPIQSTLGAQQPEDRTTLSQVSIRIHDLSGHAEMRAVFAPREFDTERTDRSGRVEPHCPLLQHRFGFRQEPSEHPQQPLQNSDSRKVERAARLANFNSLNETPYVRQPWVRDSVLPRWVDTSALRSPTGSRRSVSGTFGDEAQQAFGARPSSG